MGKSREINQDIRKRIVPRSSVQTIIRKYKKHGNVQPSYRSGRRRILSPREEPEDLVKMLAETGKTVSLSTVKRVLYHHELKGYSGRRKTLLQNHRKKARLQFATAHGDKNLDFWRHFLCFFLKCM
uniref:Transposase Tc1-like domain-containing protein n=1 Tax=Sander lucioperca TaxID=283035 RepID=A0A8C9YTA2_SANLU